MTSVPPSPQNAPRDDARAFSRWAAALSVAAAAFTLYHATLLPGVDFGDSGSIQTTVGSPLLTPRDGYPLYFAIGALILRITGAPPAYAMNLTSAIEGAVACGLFVLVASELTGSAVAAVAGALLFGVSYTFWSQAVTAEVYALHACFVLASTLLLLQWQRRPSTARLAAFFCCYAFGFGNHLSMILLLPGFAAFLLVSAPRGWRSMFSAPVVALAVAAAGAGAALYLWNMRTLWFQPQPPESVGAAVRTFWYDVTKSDWRDTMVLNVPRSMLRDHAAMYWFDLRQQFGLTGIFVAAVGAAVLLVRGGSRAVLLALLYIANVAFAFGYNVGDSHVFYLPSHLVAALVAVCGVAWADALLPRRWSAAASIALVLYSGARLYRDFPALDRSRDTRATRVLEAFTRNADDQHAIVLVDLNWQIANGLSYFTKAITPEVASARIRDVLLYAPALIRDNLEIGRTVVLNDRAAAILSASYGPLFTPRRERAPRLLRDIASSLPRGTRYALCILKPTRDFELDRTDVVEALRVLNPPAPKLPSADYFVLAGVAGETPTVDWESNGPFTRTTAVAGVPIEIRMESWLASDTIRRMGFGHVIANRRHTLVVERGVSFVAFDDRGAPIDTAYFANIFAELARYVIGADAAGTLSRP